MATTKKRANLFESEEGVAIQQALKLMVSDRAYNTGASYSANTVAYPDHMMSFVDKHLRYLNAHPAVDTNHYLANLRLITKVRH